MDLTQVANAEILNRVEKLSRTERKITHLILWHLVEVESRRLYLDLGYTSLFKYMTAHLHYSEDAAYRRIQAARLLKKVPQFNEAIADGSLNLTQLTQVQKCLSKEIEMGNKLSAQKTQDVLQLIQNKSGFETQKILAVEFSQPLQMHETLKPQRDDSVRIEITFTSEQMKELELSKGLLSHVLPNPTWAELISYLAQIQIKKHLGKSRKNSVSAELPHEIEPAFRGFKSSNRDAIKISTRRALLLKSDSQCEFVHEKLGRCGSKFQLQVDHKVPVALGGTNELGNLRILCGTHNRFEARRMRISQR